MIGAGATAVALFAWIVGLAPAYAAEAPVGLGTAGSYAVLGGQTVTNTGPSVLNGNLGVSPGSSITGFPPGLVFNGVIHAADPSAAQAQSDLTIAYNDAAGRPSGASVGVLVSETLLPGVYTASSQLAVNGALTLDGQGNANSVFIFQAGSTLITASGSSIVLTNSAQACNVFWQVGSSATLGTSTSFKGNILALTSISVTTGVTVEGRALARNGSVTLDNNVFLAPGCATTPTGTATATVTPTETTTVTPTETTTVTPTETASVTPVATPSLSPITVPSTTTPAVAVPLTPSATVPANGAPLADTGGGAANNRGANIDTATHTAPESPARLVSLLAAIIALSATLYLGWTLLIPARRRAS
ncbi:DUF3494 domain-containing protein [Arthrobacter sp. ISL-48]|nr:DUF3494 domain-containing protein [Arthrobacter sp. ISL-48]